MFHIRQLDQLESVALEDSTARTQVLLAPQRGGLVTRFRVGDEDVLFMDDNTLQDASKNVRGGVPVLFPTPGKLVAGNWSYGSHGGSLRQHGFARNLPWAVSETDTTQAARCTLTLSTSESTRELWPWEFQLEHRILVAGQSLRIEQRLHNLGVEPMPFALGFHPYFHVPQADKAGARVSTEATRAFDNVRGETIALHGIDLSQGEVDLHLLDHNSTESALTWSSTKRRVVLRASPEYRTWVVWTLPDRDFVCLEPWTAPANALNSGAQLLQLAPGEARRFWIELEYERS